MFGWINPFPCMLGGGPTDIETVWLALRAAEGGEHGPGEIDGVDDLARQAIATAIACAERNIERGFFQHFPGLATAGLPLWEVLLQSEGADNDVLLRVLLTAAWLPPEGATTPSLADDLTEISSQLSIEIEDEESVIGTIPGKHIAPADNDPPYGLASPAGLTSAVKPNYSTRDILRVVYALEAGETEISEDVSRAVTKLLRRRLPSWQTWTLCQLDADDGGIFLLDGGNNGASVLDVTPLS